MQMLKRSKSKEASGAPISSQTQRVSGIANEASSNGPQITAINAGQRNANLLNQGNSASKSIFNASFKELKPSKSVDLTTSMSQADGPSSNMGAGYGPADDQESNLELYLFKPQEKVL